MIGIPSSDKKPRLKKDGTPRKQPKKGAERKPHEQYCPRCKKLKAVAGFRKCVGRWHCADCVRTIKGAAQEAARRVAYCEK